MLLQVLTEREEKNSVAIASNESSGGWTKTFTGPRICAAWTASPSTAPSSRPAPSPTDSPRPKPSNSAARNRMEINDIPGRLGTWCLPTIKS